MKLKEMLMIPLFAAMISVGAYIRVPMPVCPFTLQFLFTTLAGILLGGRNGAISAAVYLVLGLLGIPVFIGGGGIGYVFQPTFGYLIGFCGGAFLTGTIAHSGEPTFRRMLTAGFAGLGVVYALGMLYYWFISRFYLDDPIGIVPLFLHCFLLVVPGDIALCFLSAELGRRLIPIIRKTTRPPRKPEMC